MRGARPQARRRCPARTSACSCAGSGCPRSIGRPLVARGIGGARGGKSPSLRLHVRGGGTGPHRGLAGSTARSPRRGRESGVPTPVNEALAAIVDEVAADPDAGARTSPAGPGASRRRSRPGRQARSAAGAGLYSAPCGHVRARSRDPDRRRRLPDRRHPVEHHRRPPHRAHRPPDDRQRADRRRERDAGDGPAARAPVGDPRPPQGHRGRAARALARRRRRRGGVRRAWRRSSATAAPRSSASAAAAAWRRRSAGCSRSRP